MAMTNRHMDKIFEDQQVPLKNWLPLPNTQSTLFDVAQQQIYYLKDEEEDETFDQEWIDLRFIPWRFFYLDYHHLKQNIVESIGKGDDIEKSLESEWSKVYDFYCLKKSEIERKMISLYSLQQQQQANDKEEAELIQQLIMDIQQLYHFAKLNCCGFTRLFMQYDRRRLFGSSSVAAPPANSDLLLPLRRLLVNKPFWDHSIELYDIATRLNYLFVKQHHFIQQEMPSFCVDLTIGITKLAINPLFCSTATKDSLSAVKNDNQNNISPTTTTFPLSPTTESTSSSSVTRNSNNTTTTTTTTIQSYYQILKNQSRSIKKYWVHPDNIVEVMLLLSSNKQLVLQNQDNNPTHTYAAINEVGHSQGNHQHHNVERASIANEKISMDNEIFGVASASTKVATIYMDSLDFEDYMARVSGQPVKKHSNTSARCVNTRVRKYSLSASNNALNKKNATNNTTTEDTQQKSYHLVEQKVYCKDQVDNCDYHLNNKEGSKGAGKKPQQHYNSNISDNRQAANDSQSWIQQRIWLKSKHLTSWMDGKYSFTKLFSKPSCQYQREGLPTASAEEKKGIVEACLAIQDEAHNKLKVPVLKVTQNRVVYTSGNNNVAVSIDTDIAMMRCNVDRTTVDEGEEEEYPYYNMPLNDIVRFPYGVIHVSIQSESTTSLNQDLTHLLNKLDSSPLLKPAHDFSSFLYGVGMLYANQVHVFPTWFTKLEGDLRRTQHRGSLLFTTAAAVSKEEDEKASDSSATILIGANNSSNSSSSSSVSGGLDTPYHNRTSNTIATIITCYDDEEDNTPLKHLVYSSSSSSSSSLLSPFSSNEHKKQRMRRSFDSYCSFDHPTSSSSDPTNCKSCMERYFNAAYDEDIGSKRRKSRDNSKEPVTFLSVMKEALSRFNRGITGSRFEKEPLLNDVKRRQYHSYDDDEELTLLLLSPSNNNENNRFSRRVALLTMACIFVSFTVSYLVYYLLFIVASKK